MYNKIVQLFLLLHFIAPSTQVPLIATSDISIGSTFINLNCSIWPSVIDVSWGLSTVSYYLPWGEWNIFGNHYKMLYVFIHFTICATTNLTKLKTRPQTMFCQKYAEPWRPGITGVNNCLPLPRQAVITPITVITFLLPYFKLPFI